MLISKRSAISADITRRTWRAVVGAATAIIAAHLAAATAPNASSP